MCTLDWHAGTLLSVNTSECARAVYYTSATTPVVFLQRERGFTRTLPSIKEKVGASGVTMRTSFSTLSHLFIFIICRRAGQAMLLHTESSLTPSLLSLPLLSPSLPLLSPSSLSLSSLSFLSSLPDGYGVMLDHRHLRTPLRRKFVLPSEPLALAVAQEWNAQGTFVQPQLMHLVSESSGTP